MTDSLVTCERRDDGVAIVTLSNGKVNALSLGVLGQLEAHARALTDDPARAVIITGGEKVFAAGADITEFGTNTDDGFQIADSSRVAEIGAAFLGALNAVAGIPSPTIAAVAGVALGGGCELALACDLRLAAQTARLGLPETMLGIIPGGGGTQRLARLVGPSRAKDLIFTGRSVTADDALTIGLVDRVVPADSVATEALEWAQQLAAGARHAIALAKAAIDQGLEGTLEDGLALEQELFVESFGTPDASVGVQSFLTGGPGKADFS